MPQHIYNWRRIKPDRRQPFRNPKSAGAFSFGQLLFDFALSSGAQT
jgi:hypothetical protein